MRAGALMGKRKKTDDETGDESPATPLRKEEFTEHVKLRRPFKIKLQHVALDAKKAMGQLIEEMMGSAINREYKRITDANREG